MILSLSCDVGVRCDVDVSLDACALRACDDAGGS